MSSVISNKTVRVLTVPEEFVAVKKLNAGANQLYALYPVVVYMAATKGKTTRLVIRFNPKVIQQVGWRDGDYAYIGISLGQRRCLIRKSADHTDYKLAFPADRKGDTSNFSVYLRITVRDEATRALMPVNGHTEYCPTPTIDQSNGCLYFNLDA